MSNKYQRIVDMRSLLAVMGRAPCCDKANVKRGPWSPEEDVALRTYLEKHGTGGNWIALPQKAGLRRCGKSCRLRWLNYLRPDIKHGCFTEEEDNIICTLYKSIGSRWSVIASHLTGRTDNDVKNYWNTKLKKKLLVAGDTKQQGQINSDQLLPLPPIPTLVKTEAYAATDFSGFGLTNQESHRFLSELPPFPKTEFPNGFVEDGSSATSSSVENCPPPPPPLPLPLPLPAHDLFLSELGFGSYSEFLNGFGEIAPWQYQSVTYS